MNSSLAAVLELQKAANRRLLNKGFKVDYDTSKFSFESANLNFTKEKETPSFSTYDCFQDRDTLSN